MDIIPRILAIIGLWQLIAILIAIIPLLVHINTIEPTEMTTDKVTSEMTFLAKWLESWLTGMVQLPSLIISIIANFLYMLRYGNSSQNVV